MCVSLMQLARVVVGLFNQARLLFQHCALMMHVKSLPALYVAPQAREAIAQTHRTHWHGVAQHSMLCSIMCMRTRTILAHTPCIRVSFQDGMRALLNER